MEDVATVQAGRKRGRPTKAEQEERRLAERLAAIRAKHPLEETEGLDNGRTVKADASDARSDAGDNPSAGGAARTDSSDARSRGPRAGADASRVAGQSSAFGAASGEAGHGNETASTVNSRIGSFVSSTSERISGLKPKRGRKPKADARVLTRAEADNLRDDLIDALRDAFRLADELIRVTKRGHAPVEIWSDADEQELGAIADVWLKHAKVSIKSAERVRSTIAAHKTGNDMYILAAFFGTRALATYREYKQAGGMTLK